MGALVEESDFFAMSSFFAIKHTALLHFSCCTLVCITYRVNEGHNLRFLGVIFVSDATS